PQPGPRPVQRAPYASPVGTTTVRPASTLHADHSQGSKTPRRARLRQGTSRASFQWLPFVLGLPTADPASLPKVPQCEVALQPMSSGNSISPSARPACASETQGSHEPSYGGTS